ncbi:hypothetical protein LJJ44_09755 [Pseudomonas sp. B24_DOA]|nr:hypothetical protein LJJ44_09755 [Pseudomonas sp. B24_DOA]
MDTTTIKDVNAEIALFISEGQFYYGVVTRLYYIIRRASSNIGESPALTFIFNLIRPGLKDRLTVPGGHSELKLLLPDSIKNGVGADFVSAQVRVQYPYCRAYDLITLICNGETLDVEVQPTQAPVPPSHGSETPLNIEITVDKAFLMRAKRNDNKLDFLFTVHDQLLNSADPDAPRSPPQTVDEDLDGLLFLKAILREIEGDTSDEPDIIDLKKLAKNDLTVAILTADGRIAVGDEIKGIYTATRTGFPDIVEPLNGTVEKGDFEPKKTCILKVPNHKVIAGSTVTVTYEVKRNGSLLGKSQTAKAQVIGTSLELKPPSVLQANGTTLAPLDALSKLTIAVPQGNTLPSDLLSVRWTAKPGTHAEGSIITTPKLISEIGLNNDLPAIDGVQSGRRGQRQLRYHSRWRRTAFRNTDPHRARPAAISAYRPTAERGGRRRRRRGTQARQPHARRQNVVPGLPADRRGPIRLAVVQGYERQWQALPGIHLGADVCIC